MKLAHGGWHSASCSSAAAPRGKVAPAYERVRGVPCNLPDARDCAAQQNAAVNAAFLIVHNEAAQWEQGMAIHASAVAAISIAVKAAAAQEGAAARGRHEV